MFPHNLILDLSIKDGVKIMGSFLEVKSIRQITEKSTFRCELSSKITSFCLHIITGENQIALWKVSKDVAIQKLV